ncbi:MAG: hypothetical protein O3B31_13385 [Chloroflexi bacterium]|nr:hypothetical protein [Chloroflexota bacterium]
MPVNKLRHHPPFCSGGFALAFDLQPDPAEAQDEVLSRLVRVIQEAAGDDPWALVGAGAVRLQGAEASSPNLEFLTTEGVVAALSDMLGVSAEWGRGAHLASERLHFLRHGVPVFVFGDPVFHGPYESLSPREVPSLWDARVRVDVGGVGVLCMPLEWELVLAVVLSATSRQHALRDRMRVHGYDSRLIVRLLREGRVTHDTEEAVWAVLEGGR